jgi:hypothetical protein
VIWGKKTDLRPREKIKNRWPIFERKRQRSICHGTGIKRSRVRVTDPKRGQKKFAVASSMKFLYFGVIRVLTGEIDAAE